MISKECTLCRAPAPPVGDVDFNRSCNDHFEGRRLFPESAERVPYFRCSNCGFLFTHFFADWPDARYSERIYNADYLLADPPFTEERPHRMAGMIERALSPEHRQLEILDYGGGNGALAAELRRKGFTRCQTYDRFHQGNCVRPDRPATLVTAFEVIEHVYDQLALVGELSSLLRPEGCLLFSTLLQPDDIPALGTRWWYACPRNGHMSLHSADSLRRLFSTVGLETISLTDELHLAYASPNPLTQLFVERPVDVRVNQ